ncbi:MULTISPECIES: hypothetical protein [Neobacillus]|uniref:Uncharacterized protein n=1 Tax=Neobacillus rhizophilus TaxID=2833579 RepID=A0A942U0Z5_9BACI|nr:MULTISPECIES: hypothetical protein [Neobacillus]MBS4211265.1 hypothetical protein [Neobacillus rhizophilus]MBU8918788.1 hypothetical protein [Bacillus sp. FJAT-29953]
MRKENEYVPQELLNDLEGKKTNKAHDENGAITADNDIQAESAIIIGGGDPNLSPDAGKPLI